MDNVVPFRRPARRERASTVPGGKLRVTGFAVALQASPGAVSLVTDHVELGLTPDEARELARDLLELADDAEARGAQ
jgi:ABC-type branched-subunit amino acid transport system ATPase component